MFYFEKMSSLNIIRFCVLSIGLVSFVRLFFGIDFTDEAFYLAMPHSFVMGSQPFVDEIFPQQFSSLLMVPLISFYKSVMPDYTGLFLFSRLCFFALSISTFLAFYKIVRQKTNSPILLLIGAIFIAFHPFNLPVLSYNTLSYLFFSLGIILSFFNVFFLLLLSGLFLVLAAFSYPYLAIPVSTHFIFRFSKQRHSALSVFKSGDFIGALVSSLLLLGVLFAIGIENIFAIVRLVKSFGIWTTGLSKLLSLMVSIPNIAIITWLVSLLGYIYFRRKIEEPNEFNRKFSSLNIFILLIFCIRYWQESSIWFFAHLGCVQLLAGMLLGFGLKRLQDPLFYMGRYIWVMGVLAGLVTIYSSANGLINSGMGFAFATVGYILMLASVLGLKKEKLDSRKESFSRLPALVLVAVITSLLHSQLSYTYRDDQPIFKLNTLVTEGPYAGLMTSKEKFEYLETIENGIQTISSKNKKILFFDEFPVGYLLAPTHIPFTRAIWMFEVGHWSIPRTLYVDYYDMKKAIPDIIFDLDKIFVTSNEMNIVEKENDPLRSFFQTKSYKELLAHKYFKILVLQ